MAERLRRLAALATVLVALPLAACSDDGGAAADDETDDDPVFAPVELPEEAEPYVDALVVSLTGEPTLPIADDQARCIAGRMVQVFQVERLAAAGIEPDELPEGDIVFEELELTDDEGLKLVDAFQQCDFDLYTAMVDSMVVAAPDEAEARRCVNATLTRDDLRQVMASSLIGADDEVADPEMDAMSMAMMTCVMGEDFVEEFEEVEGEL